MSEDVSLQAPAKTAKAGHRWLDIIKRILVGVVMVLTLVGLILNISGLVGVWAAYGPARNSVITVSDTLTQALQIADKGLTRANGYVQTARQTLTQGLNPCFQCLAALSQPYSGLIAVSKAVCPVSKEASCFEKAQSHIIGYVKMRNRPNNSMPVATIKITALIVFHSKFSVIAVRNRTMASKTVMRT